MHVKRHTWQEISRFAHALHNINYMHLSYSALICAISLFHYFYPPHLGSIQILLIDSIQNTGYRRVLGGGLKCDLSVCVCVRERGTEGVPVCYQLTFPCNPKTNWLKCYEHVCIEMPLSVHVCMANICHMEEGLHLNYYEWGKCAMYQCRLFGSYSIFTVRLRIDSKTDL